MFTSDSIREYINNAVNSLEKIDMYDFFIYIHDNYYQDQDISFMDYFLEIYDKIGQFVVPGEKLKEYSVLNNTSTSWTIKRLLDKSNFIENKDYRLHNVVQPVIFILNKI